MKSFSLAILFCGLTLSGAANATAACYTQTEMDAEMAVRLHSELMVTMLSCRTSSTGQPLPPVYQSFTQRHLAMLRESEQKLMAWYRKNGASSGESKLDRLRTILGNAYSKEIAVLSPVGFCNAYRDRAATAANWSADDVRKEVRRLATIYKPQTAMCKPPVKIASAVDKGGQASQ